jgi:hypothetical protein
LFLNLYVLQPDFGEHNFADFGRVEQVEASYIRGHLKQSYDQGPDSFDPIEPYFFVMMRCTLSMGAAGAYIRTHPGLPITERDCILSKLFQFLYLPLEVRFGLPERPDWGVQSCLEAMLDQLPDSAVSRLHSFDWQRFYEDTVALDLEAVLTRVSERLRKWGSDGKTQVKGVSARKRGPTPDLERHCNIARIVQPYGDDWRQDANLNLIGDALDSAKIPVSPKWKKWKTPARSFSRALEMRKHLVIKAIQYSLDQAQSD